jgi:hypothetical protein
MGMYAGISERVEKTWRLFLGHDDVKEMLRAKKVVIVNVTHHHVSRLSHPGD